jgi:hypothetical protein
VIDPTGTVTEARILRSIPMLDDAALAGGPQLALLTDHRERPAGACENDGVCELHAAANNALSGCIAGIAKITRR